MLRWTPCLFPEHHNPNQFDLQNTAIPNRGSLQTWMIRDHPLGVGDQPIIGHLEFGKLKFGIMTGRD